MIFSLSIFCSLERTLLKININHIYICIGLLVSSPNLHAIRGQLTAPGPLFSFGDNILPAKQVKCDTMLDYLIGDQVEATVVTHSWLVGISDRLSMELGFPIFFHQRDNKISSPGLGSIFTQFEYGFYKYDNAETEIDHLATILFRIGYPTATTDLLNIDAVLTPNFLFGFTNNFIVSHWTFYQAIGWIRNTEDKNKKTLGHQFLYTLGGGRTLFDKGTYAICLMLEATGVHSQPATIDEAKISVASNLLLLGPTLRIGFHGQKVFQCGFQYPICQTRIAQERKLDFVAAAAFTFTFQF